MKTLLSFFTFIFFAIITAQTTPTFITTITGGYPYDSYLDKNSNQLYIFQPEQGVISKIDLTNSNFAQTIFKSGLSLPADGTVVGNRFYFIEAASGFDVNGVFIQNTGKLSYYDLSQPALPKVVVLNNLNIPLKIQGNSNFVIITENTISATDPDNFDEQIIEKVSLSGAPTKSQITARKWTTDIPTEQSFENFEIVGDDLISNSYHTFEIGNFYKTNLTTKLTTVTHSFTQNSPYNFAINQNTIYFGDGIGPGSVFRTGLNNTTVVPITTNYQYNGNNAGFFNWNFDASGNAFVMIENSLGIQLMKYTSQQLLSVANQDQVSTTVTIYPNPVSSILNFSEPLREVSITDSTGKVISTEKNSQKNISVSALKTGIYILSGKDIAGQKITKKFIKK